jgi:hypothetical protein
MRDFADMDCSGTTASTTPTLKQRTASNTRPQLHSERYSSGSWGMPRALGAVAGMTRFILPTQ